MGSADAFDADALPRRLRGDLERLDRLRQMLMGEVLDTLTQRVDDLVEQPRMA